MGKYDLNKLSGLSGTVVAVYSIHLQHKLKYQSPTGTNGCRPTLNRVKLNYKTQTPEHANIILHLNLT